ncbi:TPA: sigma-70 family RNA polymerase sigma factor [Bacillus cereus]|nr:sigma-70 family RNA polymerase sigma factor [Bacillus cereus]
MYDWLKDYRKLEEDIEYLEFNLEKTKLELKRWVSGDLRDVRLTAHSDGAKVEKNIQKIKNELDFKKERKDQLVSLISKFEGLENQILKMKYIDGMTLEEIAEKINYSTSHIKKKHAELIRLIKFVDKEGII